VRWLSLRNRLSVVSGWLADRRLGYDACLSAGAAGITNTHRFKHTVVVNLPKAEDSVTLGKEVRSLYVARPGNVLVGYDAAALENRMEAHYVFNYPGGPEYAEEILSGDPHKKNAFFAFYPEELAELGLVYDTTDKDHPPFKPFRSRSKNGKYALSYGASPPKLAKTLGLPEYKGEEIYERFWNANLPLKLLREAVTTWWETRGRKKYVKGIDGRLLMTRSKHSLVNTLFQSAGSIAMDYSFLFMDKWLGGLKIDEDGKPCYTYKGYTLYRVAMMHDELLFDCPPEIAEEVGQMGVKSIEAAGKYLKFRVELTGEAKIGPTWASVH
jgi:DNA polymerase-1